MGWDVDNSEDRDGSSDTFQAGYFSFLGFAQRYRELFPGLAELISRGGLPPPMRADGYWGKYVYYQHHAATDPEAAAIFERLKSEGPPQDPLSTADAEGGRS
jgi:hypothetical protein